MTKLELGKEYWIKGKVTARTSRGTYAVIEFANDEQNIWVSDNETSSIEVVEAIPEREKVTILMEVLQQVHQALTRRLRENIKRFTHSPKRK